MSSLVYGQASTLSCELMNNLPKQSFAEDCDLATRSLYQSIPLPKDSKAVRLLKLAPANGDSPISCSLILADLDQQPGFVALSYVWGSFAPVPHTISCNSISLKVTENCWDALYHLQRDPGKEDPGRHSDGSITLWIDSICINQVDEDEKMDQIRLMGNIYSRATSVCIWLGRGNWKTDKALSYLRIAGYQDFLIAENEHGYKVPGIAYLHAGLRVIVTRYRELFHYHLLSPRHLHRSTRDSLRLPDQLLSDYTVIDLLSRPWITRMWTFQEIVLNGNPWIRCGSQRLLWRNLAYAITFIHGNTRVSNKFISQWTLLMWTWKSIHSRDSTETSTDRINELSVPSNTQIYQDRDCERLSSWPGIFSSWLSLIYIVSIHVGLIGDVSTIVFGILTRDPPRQIPIGTLWVLCMCLLYWILFLLVGYICQPTFPKLFLKENIKMQDPINAVIQQLRRRNCTEARDRYYGIQAILGRLGIQPAAREQLQQLHTIYKYLFLSLLRETKTLNLLLCTSSPGLSQGPSWIPDWSRTDEYSWFNDRYLGLSRTDPIAYHTQSLPIFFYKYPACSGPFRCRWSIRDDRELVLYGKRAGQVTWVSQEFMVTGDVLDESDIAKHIHNVVILQDFVAQIRTWSPLRMRSRQEIHPLLYMFYDKSNDFSLRPRIKRCVQCFRWIVMIIEFLGRPAADLLAKLRSNPRLLSYHINMCNNLAKKRRIFAQIAGEAFTGTYGNLPAGTQVGDSLVLIEDVSFPAILRPNQDEGNCLIGFAEVGHVGVMTGAVYWRITEDGFDSFSLI